MSTGDDTAFAPADGDTIDQCWEPPHLVDVRAAPNTAAGRALLDLAIHRALRFPRRYLIVLLIAYVALIAGLTAVYGYFLWHDIAVGLGLLACVLVPKRRPLVAMITAIGFLGLAAIPYVDQESQRAGAALWSLLLVAFVPGLGLIPSVQVLQLRQRTRLPQAAAAAATAAACPIVLAEGYLPSSGNPTRDRHAVTALLDILGFELEAGDDNLRTFRRGKGNPSVAARVDELPQFMCFTLTGGEYAVAAMAETANITNALPPRMLLAILTALQRHVGADEPLDSAFDNYRPVEFAITQESRSQRPRDVAHNLFWQLLTTTIPVAWLLLVPNC